MHSRGFLLCVFGFGKGLLCWRANRSSQWSRTRSRQSMCKPILKLLLNTAALFLEARTAVCRLRRPAPSILQARCFVCVCLCLSLVFCSNFVPVQCHVLSSSQTTPPLWFLDASPSSLPLATESSMFSFAHGALSAGGAPWPAQAHARFFFHFSSCLFAS